jgi:hypothetical protein
VDAGVPDLNAFSDDYTLDLNADSNDDVFETGSEGITSRLVLLPSLSGRDFRLNLDPVANGVLLDDDGAGLEALVNGGLHPRDGVEMQVEDEGVRLVMFFVFFGCGGSGGGRGLLSRCGWRRGSFMTGGCRDAGGNGSVHFPSDRAFLDEVNNGTEIKG